MEEQPKEKWEKCIGCQHERDNCYREHSHTCKPKEKCEHNKQVWLGYVRRHPEQKDIFITKGSQRLCGECLEILGENEKIQKICQKTNQKKNGKRNLID